MNLFGDELLRFQEECTCEGRQSDTCGPACSRALYADIATEDECARLREYAAARLAAIDDGADEEASVDVSEAADAGDVRLALLLLRIIERLRRVVAHEHGLPSSRVQTSSAFVSRVRGTGGDEPESYGLIHSDESSINSHYSAVLHLQTAGDGFDGGDLVFTDQAEDDGSRRLTRLTPQCGRAVVFSSGWENCHYVDGCMGERFALPVFFECIGGEATQGDDADEIGRQCVSELCAQWEALAATASEVPSTRLRYDREFIAPLGWGVTELQCKRPGWPDAATAVEMGEGVVVVPGVVTGAELDTLVAVSTAIADIERPHCEEGAVRLHIPTRLPGPEASLCSAILRRVLRLVDDEFEPLASSLFGDAPDGLCGLHASGQLSFASGGYEPAINVYY